MGAMDETPQRWPLGRDEVLAADIAVVDAAVRRATAVGLRVLGWDGEEVGAVKLVRERDFLLDRPLARDLYVPFAAVRGVRGDHLVLNVPSTQLDEQDWQRPPLA